MKRSENIADLALALSKFQGEVNNPKNTSSNPLYRDSKYAPLDVVLSTIRPILAKYELSFIQDTSTFEDNACITTLLMHKSGEWIESDTIMFEAVQKRKDGGREINAQGAGSAITYARRYQLSALLGISSEDDDDANNSLPQNNNDNRQKAVEDKVKEAAKQQQQQEAPKEVKHKCQSCAAKGIDTDISKAEAQYSFSKYRMKLCRDCQNIVKEQQKNVAQE